MSHLSPHLYDYLAELYFLLDVRDADSEAYLPTTDLMQQFMLAQSSVHRAIERLVQLEMVEHKPYTGVRLTARGQRAALICLRRQRIIEAFMVQVMGFDWHEVYDEARRLRHHVGERILERMLAMLDAPVMSPFGEPIPHADGSVAPPADIPLTRAAVDETYRLTRVMTRAADQLDYIASLGLRPTIHLTLRHRAPFDGPLQLEIGGDYRVIGSGLSRLLRVLAVAGT